MIDFEKLGVFYLGRESDPAGKVLGEPVLYDSRHLVTHALCVGMTGSGKTGLCLSLIEEAALDGVPTIAIDPKAVAVTKTIADIGKGPGHSLTILPDNKKAMLNVAGDNTIAFLDLQSGKVDGFMKTGAFP